MKNLIAEYEYKELSNNDKCPTDSDVYTDKIQLFDKLPTFATD